MKLRTLILIIALGISVECYSQQRYFAEKSLITFFSDGVVEDISASNERVTSIYDIVDGEIAFLLNIKDFQFPNKLMQVHFNEKYMETEKFPKSSFQGMISGFNSSTPGKQQVKASGKLTIHGVTKTVDLPGTVEVSGNKLIIESKFVIKLIDYNIKVPQIVWQNIAQQVEVKMNLSYRPL